MDQTAIVFPFRQWLRANGISPATGYRLAKEGSLRLVKIRARTYITKTDTEAWLKSLRCQTGQQVGGTP